MVSNSNSRESRENSDLLQGLYKILVDHTSDLIFLRDKNGILLYVTPSVEKTLGYKPEELVGKTTWWLIHPDDRPQIEDWKKRVLEQKEDFHSLARMKTRTGGYVWLDTVTKVIRDQDGEFKYIISTARDVTRQKKAEADKERLQTLIKDALNELYLIDPKTLKFTYGNTKALENLGYTLEEFTKLGPHDIAGNRNKKFFKGLFIPILSGEKKKVVFEGLNRRKDGSVYEVEVTLQATVSEEKQMVAALIEDISEKKKVRAEVEAINRRYRMFTEMTNDIIVQRDASGKVHYVSPAVKKHLGYSPEEFSDLPFWGYLDDEGRKNTEVWKKEVFEKGKSIRLQARAKTKAGKFIWLESETQPIKDETGKVVFSLSSIRNIDAEKKAEFEVERLAAIVEGSANEIYLVEPGSLKFLYVNDQARKNLGYSQKELSRMTPADVAGTMAKGDVVNFYGNMLKTGGATERREGKNRRKDGTLYNVSLVIQLITIGDKPVFVSFIEDITERKQAQEQLFQAQKMDVVGQLTGGIAHNFNNLLTTILASLRILENQEDKPEKLEMLELAIKSTKRGAELTHRLLAFARKQHLAPTTVNIKEILEEVESLLVFALGSNIQVSTQKLEKDLFVKVDPGEFESAILNLAINARDAMPKGGSINISAKKKTLSKAAARALELKPGTYVITEITDTGEGMTKEVLEKAFEPFFTTKDIGEGSGLGLSMVFGFTKQSGGTLEMESEPGKGTRVRIYLPEKSQGPGL